MPFRVEEILFATDFSAISRAAGETAVELARRFQARLHVLHVVPPVTDDTLPQEDLERVVGELAPEVPVVRQLAHGLAARQIVAYAERAGIDLIVLGTHGRTGVSHALLGSVAEAVVRRAPCRVLTVPARRLAAEAAAPAPETEQACIVCGEDSPDLVCPTCRGAIRTMERGRPPSTSS